MNRCRKEHDLHNTPTLEFSKIRAYGERSGFVMLLAVLIRGFLFPLIFSGSQLCPLLTCRKTLAIVSGETGPRLLGRENGMRLRAIERYFEIGLASL